jgi:hypothetical protein
MYYSSPAKGQLIFYEIIQFINRFKSIFFGPIYKTSGAN